PELDFPPDTDLFQLLWCPSSHSSDGSYCPRPAIYWRKGSAVGETRKQPPRGKERHELYDEEEGAFPRPCVLYPERVAEYQFGAPQDVEPQPPALLDAMALAPHLPTRGDCPPLVLRDVEDLCYSWLTEAGGDKVGGFPVWNHHPASAPQCHCERDMEYLLSLASDGYTATSWGRWVPIEDRLILHLAEG